MQVDTQDFLTLVEDSKKLAFVDIESTGLKGDYNSILVVSIKPFDGKPTSFHVETVGNDKAILAAVRNELEKYQCWVTYYGKGFDIPMIQTRLLAHYMKALEKRHHIDMYYVLKGRLLTGRRSQAHLLEWLECKQSKMTLSPSVWSQVSANPKKYLPTLVARCESDVAGLEELYKTTKHLVGDVKKHG